MELVLVRHGQSQWNVEGRYQGHAGPGLSELGRSQAECVAAILRQRYPVYARAIVSDLPRALETSRPWAESTGAEPILDARWREIDVGSWAGRIPDEVRTEHPDEFADFTNGVDIARGGGETFERLSERVWAAIQEIAEAAEAASGPVVVFTHGGAIQVAAARALGIEPVQRRWLQPPENCSLTVVRLGGSSDRIELVEYGLPTWRESLVTV